MKRSILGLVLGVCLMGAGLVGCSDDPIEPGAACRDAAKCAEDIASLPAAPQPTESATELLSEEPPVDDGTYTCTTKHYTAAPGFSEMTCVDPTTDVIYPGALIDGASIVAGSYTPIVVPRNPITISTSLNGVAGNVAETVDNPKLSTVRQAINDMLLQKVTSSAPANLSFTVEEVYSESQLELALSAHMETGMVSISGSFNFSDTSKRSRVLAKFVQKYYSIDLDIPESPTDFFRDLNSIAKLGAASPMYVSTVTYGRLALFMVESSYSATEIKAALDAAYQAAVSAGGTLESTYDTIMTESSIKAYIVGGSGADAAGAVNGFEGFKQYITRGGEYSATSPGAPISYKLRFLNNNEIGKIVLSSEYDVQDCELNPPPQTKTVRITLVNITSTNNCDWDDNTMDLFGWVKWDELGKYFWNTTGHNNQVTIEVGTTLEQTVTAPEGAKISLSADLTDWDSIADDPLGGFTPNPTVIELGSLPPGTTTKQLRVLGDGCNVVCTFTINVVPAI